MKPSTTKAKTVSKRTRSKVSAAMKRVWARRKAVDALDARGVLAPVKLEGAQILALHDRINLYERIIRRLVD